MDEKGVKVVSVPHVRETFLYALSDCRATFLDSIIPDLARDEKVFAGDTTLPQGFLSGRRRQKVSWTIWALSVIASEEFQERHSPLPN